MPWFTIVISLMILKLAAILTGWSVIKTIRSEVYDLSTELHVRSTYLVKLAGHDATIAFYLFACS